jgi:uncharacterized protein (TIGR04255 family)
MSTRELKNKPLVEAIIEAQWELTSPYPGVQVDPHYKLLLGRLYDRVASEYPEHEQLPTAAVPDELTGHMVQHRFRCGAKDWPLIQLGPGILTVNDTAKYNWQDFRRRSISAVVTLFDAHPKPDELRISNLVLRYIDAVEMDYTREDCFAFLKDKMRVSVALPDDLFEGTVVERRPSQFSWQSSFRCQDPRGAVNVRFSTGKRDSMPVLMWETMVQSSSEGICAMPDGFGGWIDAAHDIADDWFFKLIRGELERRFRGE